MKREKMPSEPLSDDPNWYKDAIIYQVHVKAFFDSNADGYGDFVGLTSQLDYVQSLGVNTIWLLPFYPSPLKDDGYDIASYEEIHETYGLVEHFKLFMKEAHDRGIRVITELVINHTSDQHPGFSGLARPQKDAGAGWYVWSDAPTIQGRPDHLHRHESRTGVGRDGAAVYGIGSQPSARPQLRESQGHRGRDHVMRFCCAGCGRASARRDSDLIEREGTTCENIPETTSCSAAARRADPSFPTGSFCERPWPADVRPYSAMGRSTWRSTSPHAAMFWRRREIARRSSRSWRAREDTDNVSGRSSSQPRELTSRW